MIVMPVRNEYLADIGDPNAGLGQAARGAYSSVHQIERFIDDQKV